MTVKIYVGRDSQGRPWPPDYDHEALSCLDAIRRLWQAFHGQASVYLLGSNLHQPSADFVVVSESGIGIVEFKHHFGLVRQAADESWYAGSTQIKAGSVSKGYKNPRYQVQAYATEIRDKLVNPLRPPPWLPGNSKDWPSFRLQTAVCFTNPDAQIVDLKDQLRRRSNNKPWEEFSILSAVDLPGWAMALRFEVNQGQSKDYRPYYLSSAQMQRIATDLLRVTEWVDAVKIMPTGEPYGYLAQMDNGIQIQTFRLDRDELTIGRNPDLCAIYVSDDFGHASRLHAQIQRNLGGVFLDDLGSKNGTYVNGQRVGKRWKLNHGDLITLGQPAAQPGVAAFKYQQRTQVIVEPEETETGDVP